MTARRHFLRAAAYVAAYRAARILASSRAEAQLRVYGNTSTIELAPVLLRRRFLNRPATPNRHDLESPQYVARYS